MIEFPEEDDNIQQTMVVKHLEKEMATHSSVLIWRIPQTEEPAGLLGLQDLATYQLSHHHGRQAW